MNLWQGSGFQTVDREGKIYSASFDQGVKTTDDVTFATVNTGQGANELYDMNQDVKTTDSPTFVTITTTSGPNKPVDNNDNTMPSVGIGGFTFGMLAGNSSIYLPSGGTYVYTTQSATGRKSGGSSISNPSGNIAGVIAWRIS